MNEQLLTILKFEFGFRDRHVLLLQSLYQREMDANELVRCTNIPRSRIYHFLNDLIRANLIEKSRTFPATYTARDFNKNIEKFVRLKKQELEMKEHLLKKLSVGIY